ncbi:MAG: ATP-binding protein [Treponema sp.]|nr:ATP-binding protein [Treponema sp.]
MSLRSRMILSYSLFVCFFLAILGLLTNRFALGLFGNFVNDNADRQSLEIAESLSEQYLPETGGFDLAALRIIAMQADQRGFFLIMEDAAGRTLLDTQRFPEQNRMRMQQMHRQMHGRNGMSGRMSPQNLPIPEADYRELSFPLLHGGTEVGTVRIRTATHFLLDEGQLAFIEALGRLLLYMGIAFALLSIPVTCILANGLSRPILRASGAAMRMAGGNWKIRLQESGNIREIGELSGALNHLARALQEGELRQKRLTVDVAHELRTPLTTLQGNIEAMIDGVWETTPERLASCHEEIVRLSALVRDLQRLSLLENEAPELRPTDFDLRPLLADLVERFAPEAGAKGVAVTLGPGDCRLHADRDRLTQVFVNLLSNAVKYTDKGQIEVGILPEKKAVEVSVADSGVGIPPEDLPRVFERFFRSDRSRSRNTGGSGIGLAITETIVAAHGGKIRAESSGKGSVFTVRLPLG